MAATRCFAVLSTFVATDIAARDETFFAVRVADAGGELDEHGATGMAVLPDATDSLVVVDRKHDDGPRMLDDEPREALVRVSGPLDHVLAQRDHPGVAVDVAPADNRPGVWLVSNQCHVLVP